MFELMKVYQKQDKSEHIVKLKHKLDELIDSSSEITLLTPSHEYQLSSDDVDGYDLLFLNVHKDLIFTGGGDCDLNVIRKQIPLSLKNSRCLVE